MLFVLQMARILGNCAPALDYSQEARKLWAKLGANIGLTALYLPWVQTEP